MNWNTSSITRNISDNNECSYYKLCYKGTGLDDEGYFCTENVHAEKEFSGNSEDYDLLSANDAKFLD